MPQDTIIPLEKISQLELRDGQSFQTLFHPLNIRLTVLVLVNKYTLGMLNWFIQRAYKVIFFRCN
jgi:hypothetical protein